MSRLITYSITIEDDGTTSDRRLEKFMTRIEDIFNSRDFDINDSSWDTEEDPFEEPDFTCPQCKGNGEGLTDQTKCTLCHGDGEYIPKDQIDETFDRR